MRTYLAASLIAVSASACAPAAIDIQVNLVTQMCGSPTQTFPYDGTSVQITIYGQGVNSQKLRNSYPVQQGAVTIPAIPVGSGRNIVVEVLDNNNDSAVVAHGESGPIDINDKSQKLTLFMRPTNMFVPANSAAAPRSCTQLTLPRVAHTATVLESGKVLIAGGYSVSDGTTTYLSSTEIYDPQSGASTAGPSLSTARAYAAAAHLPGTPYTIIVGGENTNAGALPTGEIYNEDQQAFGVVQLAGAAGTNGITRAVAAVPLALPGGGQPAVVLIFGGDDDTGTPQREIQTYSANNGVLDLPSMLPEGRAEASAVPIPGGVLVFGGIEFNSTALLDVSGATSPDNIHFAPFGPGVNLNSGHIFPIAGALTDGSILTLDGLASVSQSGSPFSSATNAMDWLSPTHDDPTIPSQPSPPLPARGWGGGAALLDGTLLAAGGGNSSNSMSASLADGTILYLSNGAIASRPVANLMQAGRVGAAYTLLNDGTVLITGGYDFDMNGIPDSVAPIDVYQPAYQTTPTSAHLIIP